MCLQEPLQLIQTLLKHQETYKLLKAKPWAAGSHRHRMRDSRTGDSEQAIIKVSL